MQPRARKGDARSLGTKLLVLMCALVFPFRLHASEAPQPSAPKINMAPSFVRMDLNGHKVDLRAYRGKAVLLNFWATWCGPCLTEIPSFVIWQKQYGGRGLQVIGISMDDDASPVRGIIQKYRLNYPVVMGDEKLGDLYGGVLGLPVTYLIDSHGKIVAKYQGAVDLKRLEGELQDLLPNR